MAVRIQSCLVTVAAVGVLVLGVLAVSAPAASAGVAGCNASAVAIRSQLPNPPDFEPIRANPAFFPCADDHHAAGTVSGRAAGVHLAAGGLNAFTDAAPLRPPADERYPGFPPFTHVSHVATSDVGSVTITTPDHLIEARGLTANVACEVLDVSGGIGIASGDSSVASLSIDGQEIDVGHDPQTIPIPDTGTLYVNKVQPGSPASGRSGPSPWVVRALSLESPIFEGQENAFEVVVAEAVMLTSDGHLC